MTDLRFEVVGDGVRGLWMGRLGDGVRGVEVGVWVYGCRGYR